MKLLRVILFQTGHLKLYVLHLIIACNALKNG
jgi:hypothetical protein